ncbi:hypothetical protein Pmani_007894 [Petrolisthes manimaculis]|uniref:Uncharacterized protein n=1 Tax=Petrolisthes manimaculis TaxID=1843537 RepID=A0AAE1UK96_9EUCA|nr:hypothetical protein Pmani_007894 [Petrolisthes manimaculis]
MFGCEARVGLTTSSLLMEVITRMENEDDLLAVTPIRPDLTMTTLSPKLMVLQTRSKLQDLPRSQQHHLPVSSGESEEHVTSLSPSPSDSPVSSVAERIKEIKRRRR